jgi:hypothetical protein
MSTNSTPFHPAQEMSIHLTPNDRGITAIYIDDSIRVAPDIDSAPERVNKAIFLAIQTLARPLNPYDPVPRAQLFHRRNFWQKAV